MPTIDNWRGMSGTNDALRLAATLDIPQIPSKTDQHAAANELRRLHGERATLAGWIAEALCVLETFDADGGERVRLLIEQGNALVVAVRGGER